MKASSMFKIKGPHSFLFLLVRSFSGTLLLIVGLVLLLLRLTAK